MMSAPIPHLLERLLSSRQYLGTCWPSTHQWLGQEVPPEASPEWEQIQKHKESMGQINNTLHTIMSLAGSADIPSPTPSSFTINPMDIIKVLPVQPQARMPVVHRQDHLSVPLEVMVTSHEFSELSLSHRSTCATFEGHDSPSREQLLHIAKGLAEVVQKNEDNTRSNHKQLEVLQQQGEALAEHEVNAAHLEETYKHWKANTDKRLADWDKEERGLEGYEENEGYISDFFIPVIDSNHTIHVLTPYIKLNGLYCLGTVGVSEPVYWHELFTPNASPSMKMGNTHTGSSTPSPTPQPTPPWPIIQGHKRTGGLQLSSSDIVTEWLARGQENCWRWGMSAFDPQDW